MEQELLNKIQDKERELLNLTSQLEDFKQKEKESILKTKGFNKVLYLLNQEFESSSQRTPQYLEFHKTFKREFTNILKDYCNKIEISKPNHFDISGFFELKDKRIYYFSLSDLRWSKDSLLIRTAKGFKDYTGGSNHDISLDLNFIENLLSYLERNKHFDSVKD